MLRGAVARLLQQVRQSPAEGGKSRQSETLLPWPQQSIPALNLLLRRQNQTAWDWEMATGSKELPTRATSRAAARRLVSNPQL